MIYNPRSYPHSNNNHHDVITKSHQTIGEASRVNRLHPASSRTTSSSAPSIRLHQHHAASDMSAEAQGSRPQMLPQVSEERRRFEAKFKRAQLSALLRQYPTQQAPESGRLFGEEDIE